MPNRELQERVAAANAASASNLAATPAGRLLEELSEYAMHKLDCAALVEIGAECTCGRDEVLRRVRAAIRV